MYGCCPKCSQPCPIGIVASPLAPMLSLYAAVCPTLQLRIYIYFFPARAVVIPLTRIRTRTVEYKQYHNMGPWNDACSIDLIPTTTKKEKRLPKPTRSAMAIARTERINVSSVYHCHVQRVQKSRETKNYNVDVRRSNDVPNGFYDMSGRVAFYFTYFKLFFCFWIRVVNFHGTFLCLLWVKVLLLFTHNQFSDYYLRRLHFWINPDPCPTLCIDMVCRFPSNKFFAGFSCHFQPVFAMCNMRERPIRVYENHSIHLMALCAVTLMFRDGMEPKLKLCEMARATEGSDETRHTDYKWIFSLWPRRVIWTRLIHTRWNLATGADPVEGIFQRTLTWHIWPDWAWK